MLQLNNPTPLEAQFSLIADPNAVDTVFTIVKGTFLFSAGLQLADQQLPIQLATGTVESEPVDQDPAAAAMPEDTALPSDFSLMKPGTDVLLIGNAYAQPGQSQSSVSLQVGSINKSATVFGDRVWNEGLLGAKISPPEPFEVLPLTWDRSFGGTDCIEVDGDEVCEAIAANPVGTGFRHPNNRSSLDGARLPNIENPAELIRSPKDNPRPWGFGEVLPHWEPRRNFAGTYDDQWRSQRAPYLPLDFDPRFFQVSPSDQIVSPHLVGGEPVRISGMSANGFLEFLLPALQVEITYHSDRQPVSQRAILDTVVIFPETRTLSMTWRSALPCDKRGLRIREIAVDVPSLLGVGVHA